MIAVDVPTDNDEQAGASDLTMFAVFGQTIDSTMLAGTRVSLKPADLVLDPDRVHMRILRQSVRRWRGRAGDRVSPAAGGLDWRGAVIAWFALVAVANLYMSLCARLRVDTKSERLEVERKEQETCCRSTNTDQGTAVLLAEQ